jgi:hypothetical protein
MTQLTLVADSVPVEEPAFDHFWMLWPKERRVEKKAARLQWARLDREQQIAALSALVNWARVWKQTEPEYIIYPHRWLRNERWEDELPTNYTPRHASHVPAKPHLESERGEMPQKVRDALAKFRK